jgi:hypothetical protein
MSLKRVAVIAASLLFILGTAATAQAKPYRLVGGGAQIAIGGGLPLPIQIVGTTGGTAMQITATGTNFPPLLIPYVKGAIIDGTTAMTAMQELQIPAGVIKNTNSQRTLGQYDNNPNLYAVGTNLGYSWPRVPAVLNSTARTGPVTTTHTTPNGNNIRYSNALASKFGGPAQFAITGGLGTGVIPTSPVTVYALAGGAPGAPPCTHTALVTGGTMFPGPGNAACLALLIQASPNPTGVVGGPVSTFASTPGGAAPAPQVHIGQFGPGPNPPRGTVLFFGPGVASAPISNMASSYGYPWTTAMLSIKAPTASGTAESFKLTGKDQRTAGGAGLIQLVSGALSQRNTTGPNANRAWVRLVLAPVQESPALSPIAQGAVVALMLLGGGYVMRRRLFAGNVANG